MALGYKKVRTHDAPELAVKPYDEEVGASIVFSDQEQRIFLADMSGDGLTDIVRIRNGEVCYWANMGYGRFSAKVTMGNSPVFDHPDLFNPSYIQLTDISGTGATDIIYLGNCHAGGINAYLNCCGNRWTDAETIDPFFPTEQPNKITVTDLLGNGTACIVWSSEMPAYSAAPMRYIDLMDGNKPHIMRSHQNGFGKKTEVEYKSSTYFYLKDKLEGTPWITKLAFPVQVVSRTIVSDLVTGARFVNRYTYHHGYYDHAEREFRGFGRVDQYDTEDYKNWLLLDSTVGQNGVEHHEPPVMTRTWFHTGAFIAQDSILKQYEKEYWYNAANKPLLKDDKLTDAYIDFTGTIITLTAEEQREAVRACKGMALRQEVFALDGSTKEQLPYSVATHTCFIRPLQPRKNNKNAVFIVLESEAMTFSYEREPEDARVAHTMNLKIDKYAQVEKAVSIVYGRNTGKLSLLPNYGFTNNFQGVHQGILEVEQHKNHVILTETDFTRDDLTGNPAYYRLPLPYQVKIFECQGADFDKAFFTKKNIEDALNGVTGGLPALVELPYETPNTTTGKRLIEHIQTRYLKNDLSGALNIKELESLALPWEAYQLAFTPNILRGLYDTQVPQYHTKLPQADWATILETNSKYEKRDGTNYWISSGKPIFLKQGRNKAAVISEFYLPIGYEDPFEIKTWVTFDPLLLYIKTATDAMDNQTVVEDFDFRTLSPTKLIDINGNFSEVVTDALGMVVATAIYGKPDAHGMREGDSLENRNWLFTQSRINAFFLNPHGEAASLLGNATSCLIYDLDRTDDNQPTRVGTITRETHYKTFENGVLTTNTTPPQYQIAIEYSDGLGNVALKKVQAESGEAYHVEKNAAGGCVLTTVPTAIRWIGNGRTILNNKGKPIKQYEPYFSDTPQYEDEDCVRLMGVTPTLYYDAVGRNIKTELPDHTFTKVEFDAWEQRSFDQNDNTPNSVHFNTPSIIYLDSLGRPFFSIAHNKGIVRGDTTRLDQPFEEYYPTYVNLDIEGNVHEVIDARNNTVMAYKYDMLGHRVYQLGMDNGERWLFNDCMGKPIFAWDSRNQLFHTRYDDLHRPIEIVKTDYTPTTNPLTVGNWHKLEIMVYGTNGLNGTDDDTVTNRNGALKTHFDTTGIVVLDRNDFKGNPLETTRRYCQDPKTMPNWSQNVPLETEIWQSSSRYDALNRPIAQVAPHLVGTTPTNTVFHEFDKSGLLKKVSAIIRVRLDTVGGWLSEQKDFVKNIVYNEKGQRTRIDYGNNTRTRYEYDTKTYRLKRLLTVNTNGNSPDSGKFYQDLNYTYDPVGNITYIRDDAQQTFYFNNQVVDPSCAYEYDALYRLIRAEGREHIGQLANDPYDNWNDAPKMNQPHPNDDNAMRRYIQQYDYDAVGNFTKMRHIANGGDWTRHYDNATNSNRLIKSWVGNDANLTRAFTYDAHGSMTTMPHLKIIDWNCKDQLERAVRVHDTLSPNEQGDTYHFQYDAAGQRSRKLTAHNGDKKKERLYIGGFEIYREYSGNTVSLARETLHIMDDTQRIAMVETRTLGNDGTDGTSRDNREGVLIRYQYGNHLGSASLEMEGSDTPRIISYEEYHPYGTTAYQAKNAAIQCAAKRYRYTGMERDEETGLAYHSARYYLPWLGRWGSCDPIRVGDGVNVYSYVKNNTIKHLDKSGLVGETPIGPILPETLILPAQGSWGSVLPYNIMKKFKALYDMAGKRLTENEHIIPRGNLEAITTNPNTGIADYTKKQYGKDTVVRVERDFALEKTSGNLAADNPRTARLKSNVAQGNSINYRDVFTDAIENAKGARNRAGSLVTDEAINKGALSQDANLFSLQRLEESAKKVTNAGDLIEDFDIVEHVAPAAQKASKAGKVLKVAGKVFEVGGGVLGAATGGWQVGTGIDQLSNGKIAEGAVNITEGGVNLGMTIGLPILTKAGLVVAGGGAVAVTTVTLVATVSVGLAAETARSAIKGEETPLDVADKFYGTHFGDIHGWVTGAYSTK